MDIKLHSFDATRLQLVESGQFIIRFLVDFEGSGLNAALDVEFKALLDSLAVQSPLYDKSLIQIRAKAETKQLLQLDIKRYQKCVALRLALRVFEHSDIAAEKEAYGQLKVVFNTYKNLVRHNYEAESLAIDNWIVVLRNPEHLPSVQSLGLERHIDSLETVNDAFKTLFDTRSTNTINTPVYNAAALRLAIFVTYRELSDYIAVMAKRKKTPYYLEILSAINQGRKYYMDLVAKRRGTAAAARNKLKE